MRDIIPINRHHGVANYNHYNRGGLNGLFGRLVGKLIKGAVDLVSEAARSIPLVGGFISDFIKTEGYKVADSVTFSMDTTHIFLRTGATELTVAEESIITQFANNEFNPFLQKLTQEVVAAMRLTDNAAKLTALNAVLNKINAVKDHVAVTPLPGLSPFAKQQRDLFVTEALKLVTETVLKSIQSLNVGVEVVQVTFPASQYNYQPLFTSTIVTTVTSDNYRLKGGALPGGIVPTGPKTDTIQNTVLTLPVATTTEAVATTTQKMSNQRKVLIAALAIGAVFALADRGLVKRKKKKK